jgi:hypothetical protein
MYSEAEMPDRWKNCLCRGKRGDALCIGSTIHKRRTEKFL